MLVFILMNFSFRTLCESSHRFWYAVFPFYFGSIYLLFSFWFLLDSLAGWSEMCCLFSLICEFSSFLLLLILSFILLWQEKTLYMFPVFLNLLRLVLWPIIWSIMELSLCVLEGKKKPYSDPLGWKCSVGLLGSFGIKYGSNLMFPCWFSVWLIYPLLKV